MFPMLLCPWVVLPEVSKVCASHMRREVHSWWMARHLVAPRSRAKRSIATRNKSVQAAAIPNQIPLLTMRFFGARQSTVGLCTRLSKSGGHATAGFHGATKTLDCSAKPSSIVSLQHDETDRIELENANCGHGCGKLELFRSFFSKT